MNQNFINPEELQFTKFLHEVEKTNFGTKETVSGKLTIQQTTRNELRKKGLAAFKADLEALYGDEFDIVETKGGLVIVAENEPGDFTFSWEVTNTIKALDYDPFLEAAKWEDEIAAKAEAKLAKEEEARELELKRKKKLAELNK